MSKEIEKILVLSEKKYRYSLRPAFALNRVLREIRIIAQDELRKLEDTTYIVPYLFNKRSRTFLTFAFTDEVLDLIDEEQCNQITQAIEKIIDEACKNKVIDNWRHYLSNVKAPNQEIQKKREESLARKEGDEYKLSDEDFIEILKGFSFFQWMEIYIHYKQHRNMHLNGIFFKLLNDEFPEIKNNRSNSLDALAFNVATDDDRNSPPTWAFSCSGGWKFLGRLNQVRRLEPNHSRGESIQFEMTKVFALPKDAKNPKWILLIPVHDNYITGKAYGGICATLQLPIHKLLDLEKEPEVVTEAVKKLISCVQVMSIEIAASGVERAIRDDVTLPHTAFSEFVSGLNYLQDWQCIEAIFSNICEKNIFSRIKDFDSEWTDSRLKENSNGNCKESDQESPVTLSWSHIKEEDTDESAHNVSFEYIEGAEKNLPEFNELEKVVFHFPKYFRLPDRKIKNDKGAEIENPYWRAYCDNLIRQQRQLLSVLMPKLRARKAALRSAVSAIMGRNMSHNIGSHVLARYSSMIKHDLDPSDKDYTDHRTDFLNYLQRRMDFLAEVATSDKAFWEQPLSLHETINKLNFKTQSDRFFAQKPCSAKSSKCSTEDITLECSRLKNSKEANDRKSEPILLSYITGKEKLFANVEWGNPPPVTEEKETPDSPHFFSCPGGEVGVHALYVILENIIRNSARHSKSDDGKSVDIYVSVDDRLNKNDNLIELTIIDPRTQLNEKGYEMEGGKIIDDKSLTAHINNILSNEPFLNGDGSPNPKYWGVREMQICAHYLRGLPLSDLEGKAASPAVLAAKPWSHMKNGVHVYYLSYTLYLKRAKLLAYVETSFKMVSKERDQNLLSRGIKPIYLDKVNKEGNKNEIDWQKITDESRGYGFLSLPPDLMGTYKEKLKTDASLKYALPVRTIEVEISEKFREKAASDNDLAWIQSLHEAMIIKYRNNDPEQHGQAKTNRWGKGNVYAVIGWDGRVIPEPQQNSFDGSLHVFHVLLNDNSVNKPFASKPEELPYGKAQQHSHVGLAWLDHPNDIHLTNTAGAAPAAASMYIGPRYVNWASVEPMWSDSQQTQILLNAMQNGQSEGIPELAAAAFARVVVLDERIQSCRHNKIRKATLYKYWPQTGIWCPLHPDDRKEGTQRIKDDDAYHDMEKVCDLDEPCFEVIQNFLKQPTKLDYQFPADFLVLHLTILERMHKKRSGKNINTTLTDLVSDTQCEHAQIIIVTGRGVPTTARHQSEDGRLDARYLPISALQEFLVTRPSKLGLMRALWAAAAPGN